MASKVGIDNLGNITAGGLTFNLEDTIQVRTGTLYDIDGVSLVDLNNTIDKTNIYTQLEATNKIINIAAINKVPTVITDMAVGFGVTEQNPTVINITNFDLAATYTFTSDVGVIDYTPGNSFFTFTGNNVTADVNGNITVVADIPNKITSTPSVYDLLVSYLPAITDQALSNVDYVANESTSANVTVSTGSIVSNTNNGSYVETIVEQNAIDLDWAKVAATSITADNGVFNVDATSTLTSVVVDGVVGSDTGIILYDGINNVVGNAGTVTTVTIDGGYANKLHRQNIYSPSTQTDIPGWVTEVNILPGIVQYSQVIVTSSRVYMLGGFINGVDSNAIWSCPINTDGTLGVWVTDVNVLPNATRNSQAIVTSSRVYTLGGLINGSSSNIIHSCPINADGTLGTWVTDANVLAGTVSYSQSIVTSSRVYMLGGYINGGASNTILSCPINTDGTLGVWVTESNTLPSTTYYGQAIITSSRVYMLGGIISGVTSNIIWSCPINADGTLGTWVTDVNVLPGTIYSSHVVVTSTRVYLLGGQVNSAYSNAIFSCPINADGTLGVWVTESNVLAGTVAFSKVMVTSSRVYMLGGYINGGASNVIFSAPFQGWTISTNNYKYLTTGTTIDTTALSLTTVPTKVTYDKNVDVWIDVETTPDRCIVKDITNISIDASTPVSGGSLVTPDIITTGESLVIDGITADIGTVTYTAPFYSVDLPNHGLTITPKLAYRAGILDLGVTSSTTTQVVTNPGKTGMLTTGDSVLLDGTEVASTLVTPTTTIGGYANRLHRQNIHSPSTQTDIPGWVTESSALPGRISYSQTIVTSSRVYMLGGYINAANSNIIYSCPINTDGTLGTWVTDANALPTGTIRFSQAVVTSSRVYMLGGWLTGGSSNTIFSCPINTDGTLGVWVIDTNTLPGTISYSQAIVTSNRVYMLGGYINGAYGNTIYSCPINTDGTLGVWVTDTNILPGNIYGSQAIVTSSRVYMLGGNIDNPASNIIYSCPINADGTLGAWVTDTNTLPGTVTYSQAIVTSSIVYMLGGYINGGASNVIYSCPINTDGTLGTWVTDVNTMPGTVANSQSVVTSNRVYMLGGLINGADSNVIFSAPFQGWTIATNDYKYVLNNYTIDFAAQTTAPVTCAISDRSTKLALTSKTFDGIKTTYVYADVIATGRAVQRKITIPEANTTVTTPFQSQLYKFQ